MPELFDARSLSLGVIIMEFQFSLFDLVLLISANHPPTILNRMQQATKEGRFSAAYDAPVVCV